MADNEAPVISLHPATLDIVVANQIDGTVSVLTGDGAGGFTAGTPIAVGPDALTPALGDLENDGDLDIVVNSFGGNGMPVLLGDGAGGFTNGRSLASASNPNFVTLGDLDGDGDLDAIATNINSNSITVIKRDAATGLSGGSYLYLGSRPIAAALGDIDGDGDLDVLVANSGNDTVSVLRNSGRAEFTSSTVASPGGGLRAVAMADLDSDGDLDAIVANQRGGSVSILTNNGTGGFSPGSTLATGAGTVNIALGDIDGDGDVDALVANFDASTVSVLRNDGRGNFTLASTISGVANPFSSALGDIDGDGDLDAVVSSYGSNTVRILANDGSGAFTQVGTVATGAGPNGVALGDMDSRAAIEDGSLVLSAANRNAISVSDADGGVLTVTLSVAHGALTLSGTDGLTFTAGDGTADATLTFSGTADAVNTALNGLTYRPDADFSGTEALQVRVADDGQGGAPLVTTRALAIAVTPVNDAPRLTGPQATLAAGAEDTAFTVTSAQLLQGFFDPDGTPPVLSNLTVTNGTIVSDGAGGYTVTPGANYSGPITISYRVGDGAGSMPATLSTTVASVNDAPTFGVGTGKVVTAVGPTTSVDYGHSTQVQADGKIVVAGYSTMVGGGTGNDFVVVRYQADGTLDPSFGSGGKVITPVGPGTSSDVANSVVLQADGMIVVAGAAVGGSTGSDFAVVRYHADGTLDSSFGSGGKVITALATSNDVINSVAIQSDGKIVAAGWGSNSGGTSGVDFALARYNANGSLDTGFGTNGKVLTPIGSGGASDQAESVSVLANGQILVSGTSGGDFAVVRYKADGTLDTTFGANGNGKVVTAVGPGSSADTGRGAVVLPDGSFLVAGYSSNIGGGSGNDFAVVRYNADGRLDTDFGTNGKVLTPVGPGTSSDLGNQIAVLPDGRFVVAGSSTNTGAGTGIDFAVVRYNADGSLDTSFGVNGKVLTPVGPGTSADTGYSVSVLPDGKIVVAGISANSGSGTGQDIAVVRYNVDGSFDTSFGQSDTFVGGTVAFAENGPAVRLDAGVQIADVELDALNGGAGDYSGATLTLARQGGANAEDVFGFQPAGFTVSGSQLLAPGGVAFATFTNSGGQLVVTFIGAGLATSALADAVARAVTYANASDTPPASVTVGWTLDDGVAVVQGSGGAKASTVVSTVAITAVNDAPVLAQPATAKPAETIAPGTVIATLAASDVDGAASALRYAITGGNSDGLFTIDPVTGAVTLAAGKHLDYETARSHALTVVATDAAGLPSATKTLTIAVTNVNEATAVTTTASATGTLKAGDTVTFALTTELPVGVAGAPTLILSNGASATYAGLDASGHATFTYTVAAGQDTTNLTVTGLSLNGGSLDTPGALGFTAASSVPIGQFPPSVTTADVNGDGFADILAANGAGSVTVRLGDGAGGFTGTTEVAVGNAPRSVTTADVNNDGKLDILAANYSDNSVSVRLGDGAGGFSGTTDVPVRSAPYIVLTADVNRDGKLDLLASNYGNTVSVRLGDGLGGFSGTGEVGVGGIPQAMTLADVNRDGFVDIVTANSNTGTVSVSLGSSTGSFGVATNLAVGRFPVDLTTADLNGDGNLDIVTSNLDGRSLSVLLGDGLGGFGAARELATGRALNGVASADFNGDGKADIVAAVAGGNVVSVRLGDGAGGFGSATDYVVGNGPRDVTIADVNGDGRPDILVTTGTTSGTVAVLLNTPGPVLSFDPGSISGTTPGAASGRIVDATVPALTGTPAALAAGTEDTAYTVTAAQLLDGWSDAGRQGLSVTGVSVTHGSIAEDGAGGYTIRPDADYNGTLVVSYTVTDGTNRIAATRDVTLAAVDDAPELVQPTTVMLAEDVASGTAVATLAATDVDGATSALRYAITGGDADGLFAIDPVTGAVTLADGKHLDFETAQSHVLTVRATDGSGLFSEKTLTIGVADLNEAPRVTAAQATLVPDSEDTAFTVTTDQLLHGFADPEGTPLSVSDLSVDHGTIVDDGRGGYTVTPDEDYNGPVTISYKVGDGESATPATLSTRLAAVNDAPRLTGAQATLAAGTEDTALKVTTAQLLQGYADPEGTQLSVSGLSVDHGTIRSDGQGGYTITPVKDYNGPLTISYKVGDGALTTVATLSTALAAANDVPVLVQPAVATLAENVEAGTLVATLSATDLDGGSLRYAITAGNEAGLFAIDAATGAITIADGRQLNYEAARKYALSVRATDDGGLSSQKTLIVDVANVDEAPVLSATGLNRTFTEGAGTGVQGAAVALFSGAAVGTVDAGQTIEGLSFTVSGLRDGPNETVLVDGVAVALTDGTSGTTTARGIGYAVSVTGGTATVVLSSAAGLTTTDARALVNTLAYRNTDLDDPTAGARTVTLTQITDSGGTANTTTLAIGATVNVVPVNDAPVAFDDGLAVAQRTVASGGSVLGNDTDVDGDGLVLTQVRFGSAVKNVGASPVAIAGAYGILTIEADGSYGYDARTEGRLAVGDTRTDDFTYTIKDAGNVTRTAHLRVEVTGSATGDAGDNLFLVTTDGHAIDGRGGFDTASFAARTAGITVALDAARTTTVTAGGASIATLAGIERVIGGSGNDSFSSTGAGTFEGGHGDDTYTVGDGRIRVVEAANAGTDTVRASITHTLAANVENLVLIGDNAINGTGNALPNTLTGNDKANVLYGGAGNDKLIGGAGRDSLIGQGGDDVMSGGAGSDSYIVDSRNDAVHESADDAGLDTVFASVSYTLGTDEAIEVLRVYNTTQGLQLTGNAGAQTLIGGVGADTLDGGGQADTLLGGAGTDILIGGAGDDALKGQDGDDVMSGGAGSDSFFVDSINDTVHESRDDAGLDKVFASVSYTLGTDEAIEYLRVYDTDRGLHLTGNALDQTLVGGSGADTLDGGGGLDLLIGGSGDDTFVFSTGPGSGSVARVSDFVSSASVHDSLHLAHTIFDALAAGALSEDAFKDLGVAGAKVDESDRILYNSKTGALSYDADGSGTASSAVQFAVLNNRPVLDHHDFLVV